MTYRLSKFAVIFFSALAFTGLATGLTGCESAGSNSVGPNTSLKQEQSEDPIDRALAKAASQRGADNAHSASLFVLERAYKRNPDDSDTAVNYARALRKNDLAQRALLILKPHISDNKNAAPEALTEYAAIFLALGQYQKAENAARQAVVKDAEWHRAYHVLGVALDAQGFHKQAEVAFRRGLENWKGDPVPVLNNLALSLAAQGYLDESLSILRKATAAAPSRKEIERNLRIISALHQNMQGRATQAATEMPQAGGATIAPPPLPSAKPVQ